MNTILHPLARFLVGLIFLMSGVGKIFGFAPTAEMMEKVGFPAASLFLLGAIVFEIVGALSLISGYKVRFGASLLILFLIPATLIFHVPSLGDPAKSQLEMIQVLKNLAILGALVKFWADGAGAFALDNWRAAPPVAEARAV
jgi:putative oxidoreductase